MFFLLAAWSTMASFRRKLARFTLSIPYLLRMASTAFSKSLFLEARGRQRLICEKPSSEILPARTHEPQGCHIPGFPQQAAGILINHGGGIRWFGYDHLVRLVPELPVTQLHTDIIAQHMVRPQPGAYGFTEGEQDPDRRFRSQIYPWKGVILLPYALFTGSFSATGSSSMPLAYWRMRTAHFRPGGI